MSHVIVTTNTHDMPGEDVRYCRPYVEEENNFEYFVDPSSVKKFELGTIDYPFKTFVAPHLEVFNFMYSEKTKTTTYYKRGTTIKLYYGIMAVIFLNQELAVMKPYGDESLAKPYVYITNHDY